MKFDRKTFEEARSNGSCRICFAGTEEGTLFTPCLCSGSMKYVHVKCLEMWRKAGPMNARFECPQCHYRYKLSNFSMAKVLNSRWLMPATVLFLFSVIWTIGVFISFSAVYIGLIAPTGSKDIVWTNQNMLNSLIGVSSMGLLYCLIFEGFGIFLVLNMQCLISTHSICGICAVFLLAGLARGIVGIYDAAKILTSRGRDSLREYVLDIRYSEGSREPQSR
jgi:hypothetical protein